MAEVINGYDDEIRVMVLDSLRNIKGTERVVDFIGKSLLSSWAESKVSVEDVYAYAESCKSSGRIELYFVGLSCDKGM